MGEVGCTAAQELLASGWPADEGFLWLDLRHDELIADPEVMRTAIQRIAGVRLFDLLCRMRPICSSPSYFDGTNE